MDLIEAWWLMVWKTFFPRLWWRTVLSFEKPARWGKHCRRLIC
jgi:hypothetical protein